MVEGEGAADHTGPYRSLKGVVGKCLPRLSPSENHLLIPGTCSYVTLHSKRDSADVTKDAEIGRLSWVIQVDSV